MPLRKQTLPGFLALLVPDYAASQRAHACASQSAPGSGSTGNGGNVCAAKRAKGRATGNTLLGLAHIGATNAADKQGGQHRDYQQLFQIFSPEKTA